jgi:DNA repair exonuclease SbcCD ATPase subunit
MSVTTVPENGDEISAIQQWLFNKTIELEHDRRELEQQKRQFERQRQKLERERKEFKWQKELDARYRAQEEHVISTKQKMLEEELRKLANERKHLERQKEFYDRVRDYQKTSDSPGMEGAAEVRGEVFFTGVQSEMALKKRYRDLIKIYHPDNLCGDTETLQEINREYDRLRVRFEAC